MSMWVNGVEVDLKKLNIVDAIVEEGRPGLKDLIRDHIESGNAYLNRSQCDLLLEDANLDKLASRTADLIRKDEYMFDPYIDRATRMCSITSTTNTDEEE